MHKYIKAAGFPDFMTERAVYDMIDQHIVQPENLYIETVLDLETTLREYRLSVSAEIGIGAVMLYTQRHQPFLLYYYPYYEEFGEAAMADCSVERHTDKETYSGIIENYVPGVSLIFYMINSTDYQQKLHSGTDPYRKYNGVYLSAFANEGKVLLPIAKKEKDVIADNLARNERRILQEKALAGDEDAGIQLDSQEVFLIDQISERSHREDLYSLVDQTFIPWGVECDQYSVVGEINKVEARTNSYTGLPLWLLEVASNDVTFHLCMRQQDLLGQPEEGRRIKCGIWLQGHVNLES